MPLVSVVGTILDEQRESVVQWIIPHYVPNSREEGNYLQSPPFYFANGSWCLRFYPYGDSQSIGSLAVYLVREITTNSEICLSFWIGFRLCAMGNYIEPTAELYTFDRINQIHKKRNFVEASVIWNSSNPIDIQIDCIVQEEYPQPKVADSLLCTPQFSDDFMNLLQKRPNWDVIIEVGEFILHAHMLILAARSSTFRDTFAENIEEKTRVSVAFETCDIFTAKSFLEFIYTGKLESTAAYQKDICLYNMAVKYNVIDLKLKCTQIIEQKMCADIAYSVLEFAEEHSDARLKNSAERFLIHNIDEISSTTQWNNFIVENESLAKEILMRAKYGNNC